MKIDYTGRQTEITAELRRVAERKLQKVAKLLPSVARAHVVLTADKHRQVAEVSVRTRQRDLAAVAVTTNPRLSVTSAIEKLIRQVGRERRKRVRKGAASPRQSPPALVRLSEPESVEAAAPRVIRSRRSAVKPMTVDEAALEMDGRGNDVFVFRDAATDRVTVLFRRKDGHLGLVEPEA